MNGAGTEQLGKHSYIEITKEELKSVTMEDYDAFYNERVSGSGYNLVSIICEDGTGICFAGSSIYASYGKLDTDGAILESSGSINPNFDGTYTYSG
ncbi:MAG: hypothetical protein K2O52_07450 [Oscillospiraceae bacterium]|nr:hypothetical protein [Oscillospiraceae bacterium]